MDLKSLKLYLPKLLPCIKNIVAGMLKKPLGVRVLVTAHPTFTDGYEQVLRKNERPVVVQLPSCLTVTMVDIAELWVYKRRGCVSQFNGDAGEYTFAIEGHYDFGTRPWTKCLRKADRTPENAQMIKQLPRGMVPCTWIAKLPLNVRPTDILLF